MVAAPPCTALPTIRPVSYTHLQFREYENIQELNRRVVVNFIDRIEITEDKQVHVVLNNADQFQAIMEFLEEEKAKANAKKVISFIREVS